MEKNCCIGKAPVRVYDRCQGSKKNNSGKPKSWIKKRVGATSKTKYHENQFFKNAIIHFSGNYLLL